MDSELEGSPERRVPASRTAARDAGAPAAAAEAVAAAAAEVSGGDSGTGAAGPAGSVSEPPANQMPQAVRDLMKSEGYAPLAALPSKRPAPQLPRGAQGPAVLREGRASGGAAPGQKEAPVEVPRIHPWRMHFPGVHYEAEDLDPYGETEEIPLWLRKKQMQLRNRRRQQAAKGEPAPGFKDVHALERFITAEKRIKPRRYSGLDGKQQRRMTRAVKTARSMALLRYPGMYND